MRDFDGNGSTVDRGGRLPSGLRLAYHSTVARSAAIMSRASAMFLYGSRVAVNAPSGVVVF